ncbi:hypothetical protein B0T17DRAFT_359321 [Bombardia bombarda]|uniref:Uncharacterized protein n=1 Tax=Bombardia bombarda TaxID=252184 RepID=A0AA40BW66_9PEZI|nr:hypothetical protein B0T17DRAFT_359321 [Bombardia bombarda]
MFDPASTGTRPRIPASLSHPSFSPLWWCTFDVRWVGCRGQPAAKLSPGRMDTTTCNNTLIIAARLYMDGQNPEAKPSISSPANSSWGTPASTRHSVDSVVDLGYEIVRLLGGYSPLRPPHVFDLTIHQLTQPSLVFAPYPRLRPRAPASDPSPSDLFEDRPRGTCQIGRMDETRTNKRPASSFMPFTCLCPSSPTSSPNGQKGIKMQLL